MNHLGSGHVLINTGSQPGGLTEDKQRETVKPPQYGLFAANRQQTATLTKSFKEKPRAGTFWAWLDVDPGTTARRAREEAT
ncbi:hypothetical protein [Streptomyces sp. NBC_00859]|uniref:hypothetical protein n=1 Tax=Streptomyces sp. NBC_00859 TaxID=2903682 RepID=UPI00386709B8|nr:hypothetical protein OG584_07810 [Streptomyces sp. NBC_00859]